MTAKDFRRLALAMTGAVEGAHMGHPDFRANGRIFATLHPDGEFAMVKLAPDQQQRFVQEHPHTFAPENGAWGCQGCTRARLAVADEETLGEAITLAWRHSAAKKAVAPGDATAERGRRRDRRSRR